MRLLKSKNNVVANEFVRANAYHFTASTKVSNLG
jgi:hypothetical protein